MGTREYLCMVCGHRPGVHGFVYAYVERCPCCESTFALAVQDDLFGER